MDTVIRLDPLLGSLDAIGPLRSPLLIAGFAGANGSTAAGAISYLAEQWDAQLIAELDPDDFYDFTMARPFVRLEDGERVIEWPRARFWLARLADADRDVILVDAREPSFRWRRFADAIVEVARALGVQETVVLASFPGATPHTRVTQTFMVGQSGAFAARTGMPVRPPQYAGPAEVSMAFAAHCRDNGLTTTTLVAIAPFYLRLDPSPHAIAALVSVVDAGIGASTARDQLQAALDEANTGAAALVAQSPDIARLVQNLERQLDESGMGQAAVSLDVEDVLADVEAILRRPPDGSADGSSGAPRESIS